MTVTEESWDEAPAVAPVIERFEDAALVALTRSGALDAESYIIGCCILDEGVTLKAIVDLGLTTADFVDEGRRTIYAALRGLQERSSPISLETLVEALGSRLSDAGGIINLMDLADPLKIGTTAKVGHYATRLLQESANRRALARARDLIERSSRGEDVGEVVAKASALPKRKPSSFLLAPDNDASVLLGNRFLNRGDGGILVGSSGMGKSSASIQMAVSWALGQPFMGIKSNGPLRVLIIQSEDSDGDIAEVMLSMRHAMKLTAADVAQVDERVRIVCDRVNRGESFIKSLKAHLSEFTPDLVIINPLQAFIDGDVTESRDLGEFLRGGLNGLNDNKFGYLLVHHTTKPATGRDKGERQWHEVMYDMAGGAELINWARFVMSLRASDTVGDFNLVLAKRGRRAGVTREVAQGSGTREEIITTIPLRHAKGSIKVEGRAKPVGLIFWEGREADVKEDKSNKNTGAPVKYQFNDYRNLFPAKHTPGVPLAELHRLLLPNGEIKRNILHAVCVRWGEDVEIIDLPNQPRRYRASL